MMPDGMPQAKTVVEHAKTDSTFAKIARTYLKIDFRLTRGCGPPYDSALSRGKKAQTLICCEPAKARDLILR